MFCEFTCCGILGVVENIRTHTPKMHIIFLGNIRKMMRLGAEKYVHIPTPKKNEICGRGNEFSSHYAQKGLGNIHF